MTIRIASLLGMVMLCATLFALPASADTHLIIPHFSSLSGDQSYLEINNTNGHEVAVELRAVSSSGLILGSTRVLAGAETRKAILLQDAFAFGPELVTGWIEITSADEDISVAYRSGDDEHFAADVSDSLEIEIGHLSRPLVRVANPNGFPIDLKVMALNADGELLGERSVFVTDSGLLELPVRALWASEVASVKIFADGEMAAVAEEDTAPGAVLMPTVYTFSVNPPPPVPSVASLRPGSATMGSQVLLTLLGKGLRTVTGVEFNYPATNGTPDSGIITISKNSRDDILLANLLFSFGAQPGLHSVVLITPSGRVATSMTFQINPLPIPNVTQITPASAKPGATSTMRLLGTDLSTVADVVFKIGGVADPTVTASRLVVSSGQVLAGLAVTASAATGDRSIMLVLTNGLTSTTGVTFKVLPTTTPLVTGISPTSGAKGTSAVVHITGGNFVAGATSISISGGGITVTGLHVDSPTAITATFNIVSSATVSARDVLIQTRDGSSNRIGFSVTNAAPTTPTLTTVNPPSGIPGSTFTASITGANFLASNTALIVNGAPGVTIANFVIVNPSLLTARITIDPRAVGGTRTVKVTTPGGSSNTLDFKVTPTLSLVAPGNGKPGTTFPVSLSGTGFIPGATTVNVSPSTGVTVGSVSVISPLALTVNITLDSEVSLGTRSISVTTTGGATSSTRPFAVVPGLPTLSALDFAVISTDPSIPRRSVNVTLTGTNFVAGQSTVQVSPGTGVAIPSTSVVNSTTLTARFDIDPVAFGATRNVSVTTPGGVSNSVPFVLAVQQPTITGISPASGLVNTNPTVTLTGSGFTSGAVVNVTGGSGTTAGTVTASSSTSLTFTLAIHALASIGDRGITVTTAGGTSNTKVFAVVAGAPALDSGAISATPGSTTTFTLSGTNFVTGGTNITIGSGSGVAVNSVNVLSATSLQVSLTIASNASGTRTLQASTAVGASSPSVALNIVPTLAFLSTATGKPGTTIPITLFGTGFVPVSGGTTVSVTGGTGISVVSPAAGPTSFQVTTNITIDTEAALGTRSFYVTTAGGSSGTMTFTIVAGTPTLSSIETTVVSSDTFDVVLRGSNFVPGATNVVVAPSGVTVSNIAVANSTTLTARFVISTLGVTRTVKVNTAGGDSNTISFLIAP